MPRILWFDPTIGLEHGMTVPEECAEQHLAELREAGMEKNAMIARRQQKEESMSLMIDVDRVAAVLLADGWHIVKGKSFTLDSYEYIRWSSAGERGDFEILHGGGQNGVCATGFSFKGDGIISGPLTAILAVRTAPEVS